MFHNMSGQHKISLMLVALAVILLSVAYADNKMISGDTVAVSPQSFLELKNEKNTFGGSVYPVVGMQHYTTQQNMVRVEQGYDDGQATHIPGSTCNAGSSYGASWSFLNGANKDGKPIYILDSPGGGADCPKGIFFSEIS